MGGRTRLIIDTSADLDEAVLAARHSAFGFQGQKCSACSRLIVVDPAGPQGPAFRHVVDRLVEATKAAGGGRPTRPGTDVGPVIDAEAAAKIRRYIDRGRVGPRGAIRSACRRRGVRRKELVTAGAADDLCKRAGEPRTGDRRDLRTGARGHARFEFRRALRIATSCRTKLTGGVFSRKPSHIEQAKRVPRGQSVPEPRHRHCSSSGQPFGGFRHVGRGSKASGADHLLQFVEPRASCETRCGAALR